MHKRISMFLWILCLLLVLVMPVSANVSGYYVNQENGFEEILQDDAGILDELSFDYDTVSESMDIINTYGHAALLTVSKNEDSAAYLAKNVYQEWFGTDSGVLFLIDLANRDLYIYSYGKVYKALGRSGALTIADNVYRFAAEGDYETCVQEAFRQIADKLQGRAIAQPMRYLSAFFMAILVAMVITFIMAKESSSVSLGDEKDWIGSIRVEQNLKNAKRLLVMQTINEESDGSDGGSSGGGSGGSGSGGGGGGHGF